MADHDLIIEPAVRLAERDHDRGDGRSSTVISVRSIGRMKMTEPPLQTNKVWAVMLYSNSGDVIGGVRTAPHLFRTRDQAMAEAVAWGATRLGYQGRGTFMPIDLARPEPRRKAPIFAESADHPADTKAFV